MTDFKIITFILLVLFSPTFYSMSSSNELVFYEERNLPIRDAINHVAKVSGKKILFDSEINGTSSFSITGIPWRRVLSSFLKVHNLNINESNDTIFIQKNNSLQVEKKVSEMKRNNLFDSRIDNHLKEHNLAGEKSIDNELEIKGVSGSDNSLKAIVSYRGRNQTWSVGNMIDEKYRVLKIEEDGLTLLDLNKNDEVVIKFY